MDSKDLTALTTRLDEIISLLKIANKPPSLFIRLMNGIATGAGILGILSVVDVIRNWIGG